MFIGICYRINLAGIKNWVQGNLRMVKFFNKIQTKKVQVWWVRNVAHLKIVFLWKRYRKLVRRLVVSCFLMHYGQHELCLLELTFPITPMLNVKSTWFLKWYQTEIFPLFYRSTIYFLRASKLTLKVAKIEFEVDVRKWPVFLWCGFPLESAVFVILFTNPSARAGYDTRT